MMKYIVNSKELPDELKPQKATDSQTQGTTSMVERSVDNGNESITGVDVAKSQG